MDNLQKNEYLTNFKVKTTPLFKQGFTSLYVSCQKVNKIKKNLLKDYQKVLEGIPKWNSLIIDQEYDRFIKACDCAWLGDLIMAVFKATIRDIMIFENIDHNMDIFVPTPKVFIHSCYIEIARSIWKKPQLCYHNFKGLEAQKNDEEFTNIIHKGIDVTINKFLPFENIVQNYVKNKKEESAKCPKKVNHQDKESKKESDDDSEDESLVQSDIEESIHEESDEDNEDSENSSDSESNDDDTKEINDKKDQESTCNIMEKTDESIKEDSHKDLCNPNNDKVEKINEEKSCDTKVEDCVEIAATQDENNGKESFESTRNHHITSASNDIVELNPKDDVKDDVKDDKELPKDDTLNEVLDSNESAIIDTKVLDSNETISIPTQVIHSYEASHPIDNRNIKSPYTMSKPCLHDQDINTEIQSLSNDDYSVDKEVLVHDIVESHDDKNMISDVGEIDMNAYKGATFEGNDLSIVLDHNPSKEKKIINVELSEETNTKTKKHSASPYDKDIKDSIKEVYTRDKQKRNEKKIKNILGVKVDFDILRHNPKKLRNYLFMEEANTEW